MEKSAALSKLKQQLAKVAGDSAATSHLRNDAYIEDFERGFSQLACANASPPERIGAAPARKSPVGTSAGPDRPPYGLSTRTTGRAVGVPGRAASASPAAGLTAGAATAPPAAQEHLVSRWANGPQDEQGTLIHLSDRPSLCSAADWERGEVVVGSSDHALYVVDVKSQRKTRTLYSKSQGHTEWVTCVAVLPDGKVLSGGMDSKLWQWGRGSSRGGCGSGHSAPVSQVAACSGALGLAVSSSYDKTLRLWSTSGTAPLEASCLQGHAAPVLQMACHPVDQCILSGDRGGHVMLWDVGTGATTWHLKNVHSGHVTALAWGGAGRGGGGAAGAAEGQVFASGGQDGVVRVWDPRGRECVARMVLHAGQGGKGAVGNIIAGGAAACGLIVTAGADKTVRILDPVAGYQEVACLDLPDFPYHMVAAGGLALVGCGDGSLLVVDVRAGRVLYGLGSNKAAVRTIDTDGQRLVASGDDGNAMVYEY